MISNLKQLMKDFSTEEQCRAFLIRQRWNGKPECPYCGSEKHYRIEQGKRFKCGNKDCLKKYSVTVGTVFHASNIPLTVWMPALYLASAHKKGISSCQLARDLGVTQKTAWFMLHRIRESLRDKNSPLLSGTIEVDETYLGKKFRSEYKGATDEQLKKDKRVLGKRDKGIVVGLAQRDGNIKVQAFSEFNAIQAREHIKANVVAGSTVYSDQSGLYRAGLDEYTRDSVSHNARPHEWVRGDVHVNTIESFWGMMKRGIYGIYHHVSYKHLQRYCDEFAARRNSRQLKDGERFELCLTRLEGRLDYITLTNKQTNGKSNKDKQAQS